MNTTQATATDLAPLCAEMVISNTGAPTTAPEDDPLDTVYNYGAYSRQIWYRLTNTSSQQAYARFIVTNDEAGAIDLIGAIYLDNPASYPVPIERTTVSITGDQVIFKAFHLSSGNSFSLGVALKPGETVWLELAGDDSGGIGWDGNLLLEWGLVAATFYDALSGYFDDPQVEQADYVANLEGSLDSCVSPGVTSYCKIGTKHFALAIIEGTATSTCTTGMWKLEAWVWDEGGSATRYPLGLTYFDVGYDGNQGNPGKAGPSHPILRTDGTNVWAVYYIEGQGAIQCKGLDCNFPIPFHTVFTWAPAVSVWNGSGFTDLGAAGGRTFKWSDPYSGYAAAHSVGQLTAAASEAEPGVLHVVWSEAGVTSVELCGAGIGCAIQSYAQRLVYARFSATGAVVLDQSIFEDAGHDPDAVSYYISGCEFITNAFGSLILFYSQPTAYNPQLINSSFIVTYGSTIQMYSIDPNSGAPSLLQSYDFADDFPTITSLWGDFGNRITGTQQFQPPYQGDNTIFISTRVINVNGPVLILKVIADGSSPITYFDAGEFIADSYTDNDNLWFSFPGTPGTIADYSLECPAMPTNANYHAIFPNPCIPYGAGIGNKGMEFIYDAPTDSFYTLGWNCLNTYTSPVGYDTLFAPIKIPILRDYLVCSTDTCVIAQQSIFWFFRNGTWHNAGNDPDYNLWFFKDGIWRSDLFDSDYALYGDLDATWQN